MTEGAFYTRDGDRFVPTGLGVSPWNDKAQLGVALAGLVAHAVDHVPAPAAMTTARLTIDILGAAPIEPLVAVTRVLREGKRLQLVEIDLQAGGRSWVRASALRIRTVDTPDRGAATTRPFPVDAPLELATGWVESRRVEGDYREAGPGAFWIRITVPVVGGSPLSPLERAAMAADFGTGAAPLLPLAEWTLANVDIALHLTRPPRGEWLLVDARSESAGNGLGIAHSMIGDADGMIGMAHQTIFLERRAGASRGRNDGVALDIPVDRMPSRIGQRTKTSGAG